MTVDISGSVVTRTQQWTRDEGWAGFLGSHIYLLFDRFLYPLGLRGATKTARLILGQRPACFHSDDHRKFCFPASDSYYGQFLYTQREYEPEVFAALRLFSCKNLLDCGANYGLISVSAIGLEGRIVAVELAEENYAWLCRNAELNNHRFVPVHAAMWSEDGVVIAVERNNSSHASWSGRPSTAGVASRSVDSLVEEWAMVPSQTLIKIDCEGAERRVLAGATKTASGGGIFLLEEHGADLQCELSRMLFAEGWTLYRWREQWEPTTLEGIQAIKRDPTRGYNILARPPGINRDEPLCTKSKP